MDGLVVPKTQIFQFFNLFHQQQNFVGSTICHVNLSSTVEGEGVIHIFQKIPQKSVNNKGILSNIITKQGSYVENIPFFFFEPFESLVLKFCTKQCSSLKSF